MKIEIGTQRPEHFKEAWPGEYSYFSHFEHSAIVPHVLSLITTKKQNGKPNACFHSGAVFTGDPSGYYVVLPGLTPLSHTGANILRDKVFCVNFPAQKYYHLCKKTVLSNGDETDEIAAGGFTAETCTDIDCPRIKEAIMSFECELSQTVDVTGQGKTMLVIGKVLLAAVDENCHLTENICGPNGFMYNIPSPQSPLTDARMPTAAAYLTPFEV